MNLIDQDELLKFKREVYDYEGHPIYAVPTGIIMRSPTVDAVPVRRGRWIPHITEDGYKSGHNCSVCGVWLVMPNGLRKYCCDCGAKMEVCE